MSFSRTENHVVIYRPIEDGIMVLLVIHGARDIPTIFRELFRRARPGTGGRTRAAPLS